MSYHLVQGWRSLVFDKSWLNAYAQSGTFQADICGTATCLALYCSTETNKCTVKTGIPWTSFKMTPIGGVKLTLHMQAATIVARIIIVHIAGCRASINQLMQVQLAWVHVRVCC